MASDGASARLDRNLAVAVATGLAAYYGLTMGGHHYSIDGIVMFEAAKRLLFHGSLVFSPPAHWRRIAWVGHPYGVGLTLAYLPALILIRLLAPSLTDVAVVPYENLARAHHGNLVYTLACWVNPLITATTAALVFRLARSLHLSPAWSVAAALAFGAASPAAAYARFDFAQPLAGLALTGALLLLQGRVSRARIAGAGACFGALILTRPEFPVFAPVLVACVIARRRQFLDGAIAAAPISAAIALNLLVNRVKFGAMLETGIPIGAKFHHSIVDALPGLAGLLVGPSNGLLIFFPLASLGLLGLARMRTVDRPAAVLWSGLLVAGLAFYAAYRIWYGGWSWGPRFLLPFVGPLAVSAAFWAASAGRVRPTRRRHLFFGLGLLGLLMTWTVIVVDVGRVYTWFTLTHGSVGHALLRFQIKASPLVSSWRLMGTNPPISSGCGSG